jgi:hypothetical protein
MASSNASNILIFAGIGLAAWWIYETYFSGSTAAASSSGTTSSGTGAGPSTTSSSGTSSSPSAPPVSGNAPTPAFFASLLLLLRARIAGANDPAVTTVNGDFVATPYVFNFYLESIGSGPPTGTTYTGGGWPPDVNVVFSGNVQPISLTAYWNAMSSYLSQTLTFNSGVSGLGILEGLGMIAAAGRRWPEVATQPWNGGEWPSGGGWWWQGGGRAVQ